MQEGHLFYGNSATVILVVTTIVLMSAAVLGFLLGRLSVQRVVDKSSIGGVQASILGLLALLLGFTFSAAFLRYDTRRMLVIDEANALGTTFLRAQTLPEPYRSTISKKLHAYIDLRNQSSSFLDDLQELRKLRLRTETMQQEIWWESAKMARQAPNPVTAIFLQSLNESIDIYATRLAMFFARVPDSILWILACISIAALGVVGYGFGVGGQPSWLIMLLVSFLVAAVIVMIVDLDRPEAGPVRISQQSMIDLSNSLSDIENRSR